MDLKTFKILQRIENFKEQGIWKLRKMHKWQDQSEQNSPWKTLLADVMLRSEDFAQERQWKMKVCKLIASNIKTHVDKKDSIARNLKKNVNSDSLSKCFYHCDKSKLSSTFIYGLEKVKNDENSLPLVQFETSLNDELMASSVATGTNDDSAVENQSSSVIWKQEDDALLFNLFTQYSDNWDFISDCFNSFHRWPGRRRTPDDCKYRIMADLESVKNAHRALNNKDANINVLSRKFEQYLVIFDTVHSLSSSKKSLKVPAKKVSILSHLSHDSALKKAGIMAKPMTPGELSVRRSHKLKAGDISSVPTTPHV